LPGGHNEIAIRDIVTTGVYTVLHNPDWPTRNFASSIRLPEAGMGHKGAFMTIEVTPEGKKLIEDAI
jgi:hypothetical protein